MTRKNQLIVVCTSGDTDFCIVIQMGVIVIDMLPYNNKHNNPTKLPTGAARSGQVDQAFQYKLTNAKL